MVLFLFIVLAVMFFCPLNSVETMAVAYCLCGILFVPLYMKEHGREKFIWKRLPIIILFAALCQLFSFFLLKGLNILMPILTREYARISENQMQNSNSIFLYLVAVCILTPVAEEFVFRGMVYHNMRNVLSFRVTTILTMVMFGFYHMNVVQFICLIPFGLVVCILYEREQCIWMPVLFHSCYNLFGILFFII